MGMHSQTQTANNVAKKPKLLAKKKTKVRRGCGQYPSSPVVGGYCRKHPTDTQNYFLCILYIWYTKKDAEDVERNQSSQK